MKKIKSQKEIVLLARSLKKQGKKIVVYNGSFDLIHAGHAQALKEAKNQGDILIVLLNSDQSIRTYKGPNRPIVPEKERAEMLAALESVDYVVLFDDLTPVKMISEIKPDVYCSGYNWGKNIPAAEAAKEAGAKIHLLRKIADFSTTNLIRKILAVYSKPEVGAVFLDRDGTINLNEPHYVHRIEDFKFLPGAIQALKNLSKLDKKIVITTNQSGIGLGYFKEKDLIKLNSWLIETLKSKGARIDGIYYCPHKPDENCSCRSPKPGLLIKAAKEMGISLSKSWMVGDRERDVLAGKGANLKTIVLESQEFARPKTKSGFYAKNLLEASKIIISNEKNKN